MSFKENATFINIFFPALFYVEQRYLRSSHRKYWEATLENAKLLYDFMEQQLCLRAHATFDYSNFVIEISIPSWMYN